MADEVVTGHMRPDPLDAPPGGAEVKPYALDENYRINHDGRMSFMLEKQRFNKAGERIDRWDLEGYYQDVSQVCRAWARKLTLESDAELPVALSQAMADLERVLQDLSRLDFQNRVGGRLRPVGGG